MSCASTTGFGISARSAPYWQAWVAASCSMSTPPGLQAWKWCEIGLPGASKWCCARRRQTALPATAALRPSFASPPSPTGPSSMAPLAQPPRSSAPTHALQTTRQAPQTRRQIVTRPAGISRAAVGQSRRKRPQMAERLRERGTPALEKCTGAGRCHGTDESWLLGARKPSLVSTISPLSKAALSRLSVMLVPRAPPTLTICQDRSLSLTLTYSTHSLASALARARAHNPLSVLQPFLSCETMSALTVFC
jgi:hypothetical protein